VQHDFDEAVFGSRDPGRSVQGRSFSSHPRTVAQVTCRTVGLELGSARIGVQYCGMFVTSPASHQQANKSNASQRQDETEIREISNPLHLQASVRDVRLTHVPVGLCHMAPGLGRLRFASPPLQERTSA
jgi:hypothetical protein